jgi:hypothetical protein
MSAVAGDSVAHFANIVPGDVFIALGGSWGRAPKDLEAARDGDMLAILRGGQELRVETR